MKSKAFQNPLPVAVLLVRVTYNGRHGILAGCRAIAPHVGDYALPGGYVVSSDESFESAAARELHEEMGILLPVSDIVISHSVCISTHILVFCEARHALPESHIRAMFEPSDECSSWKIVTETDTLAFPTHSDAVARLLSRPGSVR